MKVLDLDPLLGTNARLAIILTLADGTPWSFTALGVETGLADGNLHVQTKKLAAAGYISAEKQKQGNRRVTAFSLTALGRKKLTAHAEQLGCRTTRGHGKRNKPFLSPKKTGNDDSQVW